jgi:hypothetical protein
MNSFSPQDQPAPTAGVGNPYQSPAPEAPSALPDAFTPLGAEGQLKAQVAELLEAGKNGASWFYWIAGASIVNSVIAFAGGGIHFVVGLGATLIVDLIASGVAEENPQFHWIAKGIAFGFALLAAGFYCGIGWLANKRWTWIHWIGMVIYLGDALIFLAIGDFMSVAFHGLGLYHLFLGVQAYQKLNSLERQLALASEDPQP